jgi:membrane associated rhomboid family serine protease
MGVVFQLIIGFRVEPTVGTIKTMVVYFVSIIGATLFTVMCAPEYNSVGPSGTGGLLTSIIPWLMLNWNSTAHDMKRNYTLCNAIMLLIFGFIFGFGAFTAAYDFYAEFGAIISGFVLGLGLYTSLKPDMEPSSRNMKLSGIGIGCFYFGLSIILFFTAVED